MKPLRRSLFGFGFAVVSVSTVHAADTIFTLNTTGAANWNTGSIWAGGTAPSNNPGDVVVLTGTGSASPVTLNVPVTIGALKNTSGTASLTLGIARSGAVAMTFDGTGMSAANNGFGNAGVASVLNGNSGGTLNVRSNVILTNTNLDVGVTAANTPSISIGDAAVNTTSVINADAVDRNINFRLNAAGNITLNSTIGAEGTSGGGNGGGGLIHLSNLGTSNGTVTLAGNLTTGVGSVTQNSALSRFSLSGTNTYDGTYTITSGAISFVNRVSLFNADTAKWTASKILVSSGGTLSLGYGGASKFTATEIAAFNSGNILVAGSYLGIDVAASDTQTYSNAITNANSGATSIGFEKVGTGTLVLDGNNTYSGDTILSQGTLRVGAAQVGATGPLSNGTIQFRGGTLQFSAANTFDYSGRISNSSNQSIRIDTNGQTVTFASAFGGTNSNLVKSGAGTLILTAANTYGPTSPSTTIFTDVNSGTLRAADSAVYAGNANLKKIFGNGGVQLANNTTLDLRANGQNDGSSQVLTYGNQVQVASTGASYTINVDRESATGGTDKTIAIGTHNVGANTTLNVTGGNGFQLSIGNYAPGGGTAASTTLLNPTSANLLIASIGGGSNSNSPTVTLGGTSTGNVVSGTIANNSTPGATGTSILKSNTSTWRLNGTNTYTGTTTVNGGRLLINGSTAASSRAVTVNSGGTLGGTGNLFGGTGTSLSAGVTVNAGGTLAPGDLNATIGILRVSSISTTAALNFAPGGTYFWEMAALVDDATGIAGTDFDQIQMLGAGGNLALGGTSQLMLGFANAVADPDSSNPFWQVARSWTIIKAGASTTNTGSTNFSAITNASFAAGTFTTTADALGNVILNFTPVPEPSSVMVLGGLAAALGFRRRRI